MRLIECMMRQSTCYNGTTTGTPVGILWHDTGAENDTLRRYVQPDDNATDRAELLALIGRNSFGNDWNHIRLDAGVNAFIGRLADGSIATVQTLPWDYRPWGCGSGVRGSCNGCAQVKNSPFWVQFEICDDGYRDKAYFEAVYREAVELTAELCRRYGIDPMGTVRYNGADVPTILCHADSHKLGLGSNHGDILGWFGRFGRTMQDVRRDVSAVLRGDGEEVDGMTRYNKIEEMPAWARAEIKELVDAGALKGDEHGNLDLTEDMMRTLIINKRYAESVGCCKR